jgi:hypothetical protein
MHFQRHRGGYGRYRGGVFFFLALIVIGLLLLTVVRLFWPLLILGFLVVLFSGLFRGGWHNGRYYGRWGGRWSQEGNQDWNPGSWVHSWHANWDRLKTDWEKPKNGEPGDDKPKHSGEDDITLYV